MWGGGGRRLGCDDRQVPTLRHTRDDTATTSATVTGTVTAIELQAATTATARISIHPQSDTSVRRHLLAAIRDDRMGHCPSCGEQIREVVESDTDVRYSDAKVWECESCGAVLGVTEIGV